MAAIARTARSYNRQRTDAISRYRLQRFLARSVADFVRRRGRRLLYR